MNPDMNLEIQSDTMFTVQTITLHTDSFTFICAHAASVYRCLSSLASRQLRQMRATNWPSVRKHSILFHTPLRSLNKTIQGTSCSMSLWLGGSRRLDHKHHLLYLLWLLWYQERAHVLQQHTGATKVLFLPALRIPLGATWQVLNSLHHMLLTEEPAWIVWPLWPASTQGSRKTPFPLNPLLSSLLPFPLLSFPSSLLPQFSFCSLCRLSLCSPGWPSTCYVVIPFAATMLPLPYPEGWD